MSEKAIILDLDYTILQTDTIDKKVFEPFFESISESLSSLCSEVTLFNIIADLWREPWDVVINRYSIPKDLFMKAIAVLDNSPLVLNISPYYDYHFVKNFPIRKFLVTTSSTAIQKAKIKALNIENDFVEIVINDTLIEPKTKLEIFRNLVLNYGLLPEKTYVIGDNSHSEIMAGNCLNMVTIQILREGVIKGDNADYFIKSFEELHNIIFD